MEQIRPVLTCSNNAEGVAGRDATVEGQSPEVCKGMQTWLKKKQT